MNNFAWVAAGALMTALLFLAGCDVQYQMLYYPSPSTPSEQSIAGTGIRFWPSFSRDYRGYIGGNETGHVKGTFVVFHGNGGIAADREFYAKTLGSFGYRVILAEYPMYGGRKGELGETAFVKDADETVRLAFETFGGPIFLLGESLGCGVVSAVAHSTKVPIDGIVLITPWDSLYSVAKSYYPYLPVRLLLKDSYDNVANLASFRSRIAIVGARQDEIIPIGHARGLYRALASHEVKMWEIEGAGHNDWPMMASPQWWKEVTSFIGKP
jgi:uncharacterized protein